MELIILGSGTCAPSPHRAGPAACLKADEITILVDSAAGTLHQMAVAGIHYASIDLLLYTHFHVDHIGELAPYIFASRYAGDFIRPTPMEIWGPPGLKAIHTGLTAIFGQWVEMEPEKMQLREIEENCLKFQSITLQTTQVQHTPQSLAYRLTDSQGKSIVFSGDTDYCPELVRLAQKADLFLCECANPEGQKRQGHLMPSEAGRMAREAQVKRLVLTHFYPICDRCDPIAPCAKEFDGEILLAEDLMRIAV